MTLAIAILCAVAYLAAALAVFGYCVERRGWKSDEDRIAAACMSAVWPVFAVLIVTYALGRFARWTYRPRTTVAIPKARVVK